MVDKARAVALQILYKIDKDEAYSNILLNEMINKNSKILNRKDISLISEIVYGVTTWRLTIDEIIKKYSKIKLKKISPWILNILRMSIYQIIFLDKVPKSAAVNEGVNLAKRYGNRGSIGFTNAILRNISENDYKELFNEKDELDKISKTTSMPKWIIEELKDEGLDNNKIFEICKNSNIRPKISIRVNTLKTTKEELKESLNNEGIKSRNGLLENFLILEKTNGLENLESFRKGLFTVQDEVAGLTALILNPKQEEKILDSCSSPGGKTTYLAEIMENKGEIEAWDIHEHRTKLVEQNAKRLGIKIIKTRVEDASIYKEEYKNKFDKVLLDVPCLGIGVLKRKPDIKWQKKKEDIEETSNLQFNILNTCSKYLKENGELVYSTCSILKKENRDVILKFLKENSNFSVEKICGILDEKTQGKTLSKYLVNNKYLEVYQNEKTDGFFICKLVKNRGK